MAQRVDFYLLDTDNRDQYQQFVCRLTEKIYQRKHRSYIHADNQDQAYDLDQWLWTYKDDSFLPHNLIGEGPEPAPPIQIGYELAPKQQRDVLINLSNDVPEFYNNFKRIVEIIPADTNAKEIARQRYKHYRQANCTIETHNINL